MKLPKTILVVDNESGFHDLLRFILEPLGYVVDSAYDGLQGWKCFQKKSYDIVVSDVHMPKMKGPELLRNIKGTHPEQKVIMMSSFSDSEVGIEQTIGEGGLVTCLYKPFEIDQLMGALEQALGVAL